MLNKKIESADLHWLTDPTVFAVNRLDAHSDHICYRTYEEAETGISSLRQSLDGNWRFAYSPCPAKRPADFWKPEADLSSFGTIMVPGHIEMQGYFSSEEELKKTIQNVCFHNVNAFLGFGVTI